MAGCLGESFVDAFLETVREDLLAAERAAFRAIMKENTRALLRASRRFYDTLRGYRMALDLQWADGPLGGCLGTDLGVKLYNLGSYARHERRPDPASVREAARDIYECAAEMLAEACEADQEFDDE